MIINGAAFQHGAVACWVDDERFPSITANTGIYQVSALRGSIQSARRCRGHRVGGGGMRSDEPVEQKSINNLESMIVRSSGVTVAGRILAVETFITCNHSLGSTATRLLFLYCKQIISREVKF